MMLDLSGVRVAETAIGFAFDLADVFMCKLKRFQLSDQIDKLQHYGRYVDDIFALATAETDVATLLHSVNQAHPSTKFTLEMESTGSLPFLDVLLNRRPDATCSGTAHNLLRGCGIIWACSFDD
ncbi:hypothetical protein SprV_1002857300 [Sparganum proliferum]